MALVQVQEAGERGLPSTVDDLPPLAQTSADAPGLPAVAEARAEAERYATDVMTAFKKA